MNPIRKNIMIGTAGHVDHGKTALVKLLTGCDTDTLQEEKDRGLTIDLGFAPCQLSDKRIVGIVDVPGHSDFIRNMVAGAHGIDLVMLVVAADDGIMPQTHEHLHILTLMGLRHGLVALTKVDLVDTPRREEVVRELRRLLAGTFLEQGPICPVSSVTGEGFDDFYETLNAVAAACEARPSAGLFRMWVEDVFTIRGSGTIVTGIPSLGHVRCGDIMSLAPGSLEGRVRRIQVYGKEDQEGRAGECVALNVPELDHGAVRRGMVLGDPFAVALSSTVEAELSVLSSVKGVLKDYAEVQFHIGTAAVAANVAMLNTSQVQPGEAQMVQLRLQHALPVAPGERFVVRGTFGTAGTVTTIGGGQVLGACNMRLRRRRPGTIESLANRKAALGVPAKWMEAILREAAGPVRPEQVRKACLLSPEEFGRQLDELTKSRRVHRMGSGALAHAEVIALAAQAIVQAVTNAVTTNPQRAGVAMDELVAALKMDPELLRCGCDSALNAGKLELNGMVLAPSGWRARVSDKEEDACGRIEAIFRAAMWAVPAVPELCAKLGLPEARLKQPLRLLHDRGVLIRLDDKISMHKEAIEAAKAKALELFRKKPLFTTMEFRDALAVSRKFAVPLLDYFDRVRFTARTGHDRTPGIEAKKLLAATVQGGVR